MGTIREEAKAWEPKRTRNVSELTALPLDDLKVLKGEGEDKEGKTFHYKYVVIDDEEFRLPESVLGEIKKILKIKPDAKTVKVDSSGTGLSTKYSVELIE